MKYLRINPEAWRRFFFWAVVFMVAAWLAPELWARLGGGGGYSGGGGSSSSGGGGGGGGELIGLWIEFCFHYPHIGLPITGIAICIFYVVKNNEISSIVVTPSPRTPANWDALRAHDENFSEVLFRDFGYSLFSKIHEARGSGQLGRYSQYLNDSARTNLAMLHSALTDVQGVVVGGLTVHDLVVPAEPKEQVSVRLMYEANYTEVSVAGERAVYSHQVWHLSRRAGVLSPEPDRISSLGCVGCGSPLEPQPDGTCPHCGNQYERGEYHWFVTGITELNRREVGPALTSKAADVGLNLSTVYDPNLEGQRAQFIERYPDMDFKVAVARFQHIYHTLQKSWSEQDLDQLRPFETDSLFQNHRYWVEEYQRQNLRNVLKEVTLDNIELVKIRSDKFYDAITCRLFASMIDYTQDDNGKVLCGSTSRSTRFSEYWIFVRGRGAAENAKGDAVCPNCAAELKISMAGECEYCGSKLTSGQFDWVLSEIQQDEEYAG
ncbi:MAG: Tim44-like domain-containing protein [Verrucomicrobiota bacterium]|nr:Tim44-like domain-containing protein [Verrucomicrobiota bacterium]